MPIAKVEQPLYDQGWLQHPDTCTRSLHYHCNPKAGIVLVPCPVRILTTDRAHFHPGTPCGV
jgi:hypothetical protein